MPIRILLCDDQELVREGLCAILRTVPDVTVVGTARDGAEALRLIPTAAPDVVLMDLKMPVLDGVQATRRIRERHPLVRVLVLTTYDADEWVVAAIHGGAAGYVLKDAPRDRLVAAIRDVVEGRTPVDPGVAGVLFARVARQPAPGPEDARLGRLSDRERDVLSLLARGLSNADIAGRLYLSEGTVRNYVSAVLTKLEVTDRTQAAVLALRHGLGAEP